MPKEFYTEKDIEDLFNSGTRSLQVTDQVVLTGLAYEKAKRLGLHLITHQADNPPAAPIRPYLSEAQPAPQAKPVTAPSTPAASLPGTAPADTTAIENRIRSAVIAKLGNQVEVKLLDNIIHRVVRGIGLK